MYRHDRLGAAGRRLFVGPGDGVPLQPARVHHVDDDPGGDVISKKPDEELFSGEYWAGDRSVALGLADGIGDLRSTLRTRYGEKVLTPLIAPASGMLAGLFGRRAPGAGALTLDGLAGLPDDLISALETRAIWAKFGF